MLQQVRRWSTDVLEGIYFLWGRSSTPSRRHRHYCPVRLLPFAKAETGKTQEGGRQVPCLVPADILSHMVRRNVCCASGGVFTSSAKGMARARELRVWTCPWRRLRRGVSRDRKDVQKDAFAGLLKRRVGSHQQCFVTLYYSGQSE